jgi:outer membrane protein OmpA-like peptidoglycan-associated protein
MPIRRRLALAAPLAFGLGGTALAQAPATPPHGSERAFVVFFTPWSAALDPAAEAGLARVAEMARQVPTVPVLVTGYASPPGSSEANELLSRLRARVVADAMVERGVAAARIRMIARGATPGMEDLESRRVEVRIDDGRN